MTMDWYLLGAGITFVFAFPATLVGTAYYWETIMRGEGDSYPGQFIFFVIIVPMLWPLSLLSITAVCIGRIVYLLRQRRAANTRPDKAAR